MLNASYANLLSRPDPPDLKSGEALLTFCIPTHNRAPFLKRNLDAIFRQVTPDLSPLIRIVVSDNASADNTKDVVSAFLDKGIDLVYLRNSANLGSATNFLNCLDAMGLTRYWLLLGDDDWLLDGILATLLAVLSRHRMVDAVFLECRPRYAQIVSQDAIFELERDQFVEYVNYWMTFISCLVFPSSAYARVRPLLDPARESNLLQLGWVLPQLKPEGRFMVIGRLALGAEPGNTGGYAFTQVFVIAFWRIWKQFFPLSLRASRRARYSMLFTFYPDLILAIRRGTQNQFSSEATFRDAFREEFQKDVAYHLFLVPALYLPLAIALLVNRVLNGLRLLYFWHLHFRVRPFVARYRLSGDAHYQCDTP